jgi:streptogramin lyase
MRHPARRAGINQELRDLRYTAARGSFSASSASPPAASHCTCRARAVAVAACRSAARTVSDTPLPDGALWFTELLAGKIGRITTTGTLTEYPIVGGPVGITVGRDRQPYVDLSNAGAVARVNLDGQVTGQWALPGATLTLQLTTGFGLDIWVTDRFGGKVYRVTPYALGQ